ncbi:serine/threonine-protein kinase S6KL [Euwallacea similis]|uniref:serine/threonine-protein kinase S6KL n=1 Tax=Euwallacea similis TaxID=1736056 RepID=UPI00344E48FA
MGNKSTRDSALSDRTDSVLPSRRNHSQKITSNPNNNLRSFLRVESQQSTYSVSKLWSRISRRRWKESTLTLPYQSCKTAWPVTQRESLFLPAFPVEVRHKNSNYEKLPEISRGAFGKIYRILDLEKNEIFALKVLSKSKIVENDLINQVTQEVQIQRACGHHPFIAKCPSNWQSPKHLYIATEYIEGGELWELLDHIGALPVEVVQLYVAQIALAIDFLHNAGVIYRDLKPENILLDADANVRVIDFGLSKWLPLGRTTRTVCGTPKYMAPEILQMQPYGHSVDWWSLGVIACLMLTCKKAALDLHPHEIPISKVILPEGVFLDIPSRDLLLRLLEVQPQKRLHSVRALGTLAFYKGYDIEEVRGKKSKAKTLLVKHYGADYQKRKEKVPSFEDFDEVLIDDISGEK